MNTSHELYTEESGQVLKMMVVIKLVAEGGGHRGGYVGKESCYQSLSTVCVFVTHWLGVWT